MYQPSQIKMYQASLGYTFGETDRHRTHNLTFQYFEYVNIQKNQYSFHHPTQFSKHIITVLKKCFAIPCLIYNKSLENSKLIFTHIQTTILGIFCDLQDSWHAVLHYLAHG